MALIKRLKKYLVQKKHFLERNASSAYNLWAPSYDKQPYNLMLHLDEEIFIQLLQSVSLTDKVVVDVGCGTGRHWKKIENCKPSQLVGYDVSDGMLTELKKKFPQSEVQLATNNILSGLQDESIDAIISTLTIAHIENIEEVFEAWNRVLKTGGDVLLTDYHPATLAEGGTRDFVVGNNRIIIKNFVHTIDSIKEEADKNNFLLITIDERFIDERVRHFYHQQNALHVYEKFKGMPIIYGIHFKKQ